MKSDSANMQQNYNRTPMPQDYRELLCNFIEITLLHGCSPLNFMNISRKMKTCGWLLLIFLIITEIRETIT